MNYKKEWAEKYPYLEKDLLESLAADVSEENEIEWAFRELNESKEREAKGLIPMIYENALHSKEYRAAVLEFYEYEKPANEADRKILAHALELEEADQ